MRRETLLGVILCVGIILTSSGFGAEDEGLSWVRQLQIIRNYQYVRQQSFPSQLMDALDEAQRDSLKLPVKCGTSALADFRLNYDKLDPVLLRSLGITLYDRPTYPQEQVYDTPGGRFKIHYTTVGDSAVYRAELDSDHDGTPDYVENVGAILDSVYVHIIDTLGYPPPPSDSFYPSGGDGRYDVYLSDLAPGIFGQTFIDSISVDGPGSIRATSFLELENDYLEMSEYRERPLDAVRVTGSHEFFHAVQFGIDFTEAEPGDGGFYRRYWMEMSAVWMEEEIYDDINDYYSYLPYFFNNTRQSIQQFLDVYDFHPYASVVLAIYLSERFGRDIIRDIWLRCGSLGAGASFLIAAETELRNYINSENAWPIAFREFSLWNYFTGDRAYDAPDDIGYSEKYAYPPIDENAIMDVALLDTVIVSSNSNPYNPSHNSTTYLRLHHTRALVYDTSFWDCSAWSGDTCLDSTRVTDTTLGYDMMHVDSMLDFWVGIGNGLLHYYDSVPPQPWGLNIMYRLDSIPDSFVVDQLLLPYLDSSRTNTLLRIINPNQYREIVMSISPASYLYQAYASSHYDFGLTFYIPEIADSARIDTPIIIDSEFVDILPAILAPYPNPAVVNSMEDKHLKFKFRIPTDSLSNYLYGSPFFTLDIYTVAGEYVCGLDSVVAPNRREKEVEYTLSWDMRNQHWQEVASGVYLAVGRLYDSTKRRELLAEDKVKVVIIR